MLCSGLCLVPLLICAPFISLLRGCMFNQQGLSTLSSANTNDSKSLCSVYCSLIIIIFKLFFAYSLEFHLTYTQMGIKTKIQGNPYADFCSSFSAQLLPLGYSTCKFCLLNSVKLLHSVWVPYLCINSEIATRPTVAVIVGLTTFVSHLSDHSSELTIVQCLKTVVSYIFSSFIVIYNDKV